MGGRGSRSSPSLIADIRWAVLLLFMVGAFGCANAPMAPIESRVGGPSASTIPARPISYTVVRGDTLQAIAFRFGVDANSLARWNRLRNPDLIFVGQTLRLTPPSGPEATPSPAPSVPAQRQPARVSSPTPVTAKQNGVRQVVGAPAFRWPADGKVVRDRSDMGTRAVQILGERDQAVRAAAAGEVVYSGSGLRGYGELIILKHNDAFLSAYAHNEQRLVKEGASVSAGQTIARMGSSEAPRVMLHFEIRKNGEAVDPLSYLPKR